MSKNKYKSNRAPMIKGTTNFAKTYEAARKDQERFETVQGGRRAKRIKKLNKGNKL